MAKKKVVVGIGDVGTLNLDPIKTVFVFNTGDPDDAYRFYYYALEKAGFKFAEEMGDATLIILLGGAAHLDSFPGGMANKTVIVPGTKNNMHDQEIWDAARAGFRQIYKGGPNLQAFIYFITCHLNNVMPEQ